MRQASCQHTVTVQFPDLQARFRAPCEEAQAEEVSGTRKSPRESEATAQELDPWRMGGGWSSGIPLWEQRCWPGLWGLTWNCLVLFH